MFERFTDRARKVMALANQEADRFNHEYVGTEHILLGLVKEGSGVGAKSLKALGVDLPQVRTEVEKLVKPGSYRTVSANIPQTPRAQKVIEYSIEEAKNLGQNFVGTEHLLLGLVREPDGVASKVLRGLGLKVESIRREVLKQIGAGPAPKDASDEIYKVAERLAVKAEQMQASVSPAAPAAQQAYRVGIVGVSGYGGGEVLRLCVNHPKFQLTYVAGEGSAGQKLAERFPGIGRLGEMVIQKFDPTMLPQLDVLFASLPTGESKTALENVSASTRIVDIGGDHRYVDGWTYGLADVWPLKIRASSRVANPGCYPAATLTAIAPLLVEGLIDLAKPIIVDAKSGVSGAGRGGGDSKLAFAEVNEDLSAYGLLKHVHLPEMKQTLKTLDAGITDQITFTPHLVPMTRGILATCYLWGNATAEECAAAARKFYAKRAFVRVVDQPPHTKWATGSNLVFVHYASAGARGPIIALAAIDNLGKGAAGQAVQNANLMLGLDETLGLLGTPIWP